MDWIVTIAAGAVAGWALTRLGQVLRGRGEVARPGDPPADGWLCPCGTWNEEDIHCIGCKCEPPWGCDCDTCDAASAGRHAARNGHLVTWHSPRRGEMDR